MPFLSGRVSFARLRVTGDAPTQVDDAFLGILKDHAFVESPAPRVGVLESGFITGTHLLDTQFSYEKNGYGPVAHFALRVDSHQVPGDMKKALRMIHEQSAVAASAGGFATRADKADAKDLANREMEEKLVSGQYRKSKLVPILWDLEKQLIYCAAGSNAIIEELAKQMREAFGVKLQPLSAGALAAEMMSTTGGSLRTFEDLRPSPFSAPPAAAEISDEAQKDGHTIPGIPWVAKAKDLRDFLGNEFLMWLLWKSQEGAIETPASHNIGDVNITSWKSLDLDCAWAVTGKTTLRQDRAEGGSPLGIPECAKALATGKWPRKMGMMISNGENAFELTLQGDQMQVSACQLPSIDQADSERELADTRIHFIRELDRTLDATYAAFLTLRVGGKWEAVRVEIAGWIAGRVPHDTRAKLREDLIREGKELVRDFPESRTVLTALHTACETVAAGKSTGNKGLDNAVKKMRDINRKNGATCTLQIDGKPPVELS